MSYQQQHNPQLGATFVPGGFDDYYLPAPSPEVVAPAPQRFMPEVPENMQENLAHLELEANAPRNGTAAPMAHQSQGYNQHSSEYGSNVSNSNYNMGPNNGHGAQEQWPARHASISSTFNHPPNVPVQSVHPPAQSHDYNQFANTSDIPNFSIFPKLRNRPANVPPSDDEKEATLENARMPVLNSNDPDMQLAWAQDALAYVDAAMLHEQRLSETQPARSVTPQVEHQLRIDAMNVVQFLADQHHPKAEFMRGMWLEFGKFGLRADKKEAFRCYTRAAQKGYARAEYRMGMQYEQSNDPIKALQHYKRGSEAGDSASNYRLGMMTLLGQHGQAQDFARGIQLIRQAASTADENAPQGAYILGMLQARELPQINVPEVFLPYDEKAARLNIEKAAFLGFAKAQLKMGSAYELCTLGCEFNPTLSMHYNALASRQGESEADMAISKWFLCGQEGEFAKNEELAYRFAQRAAAAGLPTAQFAMGYFFEIGMNTDVNLEKAIEWYEKAAKNGNKDAVARIDSISKSRTLSKKDHENVAISRIKSQHGSMRGQRPARLKAATPALPAIRDDTPSNYGSGSGPASPVDSRLPNRNTSTTPYPISDNPPALNTPAPYQRSASVAPYPMEDGPPIAQRPVMAGGFAPELRSASARPPATPAFNINPSVYQPGDGYGRGRGIPHTNSSLSPLPLRPHSSVDNVGPGRGRIPGGGQLPPNPGAYRQPGPPQQERPQPYDRPHSDLGYVAPVEGRSRLQKPGPPQKQPTLPDIGYVAPLEARQGRPSTVQPGQEGRTANRPERPSTAAPGTRTSSMPTSRPGSAGRPAQHPPKPPGSTQKYGTPSATHQTTHGAAISTSEAKHGASSGT